MKKIIVKKTGIGQDTYDWEPVSLVIDGAAVLSIYRDDELIHAYAPGAWLEIEVVEE